jgi:hypothetical protein
MAESKAAYRGTTKLKLNVAIKELKLSTQFTQQIALPSYKVIK